MRRTLNVPFMKWFSYRFHSYRFRHSRNNLILILLHQQFQNIHCWHYRCEGLVKSAVEIASGSSFMFYEDRLMRSTFVSKDAYTDTQTAR
jgi:hypothetical protein